MPELKLKSGFYQALRRWDLRTKLKNLQNFIKNIEIDKSELSVNGQKVVVVSPHPDDESIGCGGTLTLLSERGNDCDVIYLTPGEYGVGPQVNWTPEIGLRLAETRRREALNACGVLGVRNHFFLDGNDTQLHLQLNKLSGPLSQLINDNGYDHVFCPWPFDAHTDHAAAYEIVREALFTVRKNVTIWLYEVWNPCLANRIVNIDSSLQTKLKAIGEHKSQKAVSDFSQKFIALAEYRSVSLNNCRYAEAFFVCQKGFVLKSGSKT